jgi:hypothetical protein
MGCNARKTNKLIGYRAVMILFDKIHDFVRYGNIELCPCFLYILYENMVRILRDRRVNTNLGEPQKRLEPFGEKRNLCPVRNRAPDRPARIPYVASEK